MALDLETPTPPEPESPTPPVAEAPPQVQPPTDPDESAAVDVGGQKMVPLSALKETRGELKTLKEKAAKADQLEQYVQQVKPYVEFLAANPQVLQPQQPKAAAADADPNLVELARSLDYYKADGSPDLERATKHREIVRREASQIAQQMVGPVAQRGAQQQSAAVWGQFAHQKLPNGQPIDQNILAKYWRALPAEYTADPRIAATVFSLAGMEQMQNSVLPAQPAPPANAPVVTEPIGHAPRGSKPMTAVERAVAAARNISETQYTELTKGFTPGRTSALED